MNERGPGQIFGSPLSWSPCTSVASDELCLTAQRLLAAYDARTQDQLQPPGPGLGTAQAYALQHEVTRLRQRRGEKAIGSKIGCTEATIREQLGVEQPIFGRIFRTGGFRSTSCLSAAASPN